MNTLSKIKKYFIGSQKQRFARVILSGFLSFILWVGSFNMSAPMYTKFVIVNIFSEYIAYSAYAFFTHFAFYETIIYIIVSFFKDDKNASK